MRPEEIAALGDLAGEAAAGAAVQIRETHMGISGRVWRLLGPATAPVRIVHDQIAGAAYSAARDLTRVFIRVGARAATVVQPADASSIQEQTLGRAVVGVLNGAVGDTLERRGNVLALPMVLRHGGQDLAVTTDAIRLAYPEADSRLVVFVHGLGQTDDAWRLHAGRRAPYGARLHDDLGYTPLYVRYNSGRRVSDNGRDLARLLGSVVAAWPSDVREIALIGHSIGGLVACSACQFGAGSDWADKVRHVFTLGTSHAGSPLERVIHAIAGTLGRLPETRPLARAIDVRSAGIKDLRYGSRALERTTAPFLPTAEHYFLSVTSARGGATQLDLLNHPAIYEQIRSRLVASKALPPAR